MIEFNLEAKLAQEVAREKYKKAMEILNKDYEVKYEFMTSTTNVLYKMYSKAYTKTIIDDISNP